MISCNDWKNLGDAILSPEESMHENTIESW